jgi:hypothetical protein
LLPHFECRLRVFSAQKSTIVCWQTVFLIHPQAQLTSVVL